jgi:hypothetical protein
MMQEFITAAPFVIGRFSFVDLHLFSFINQGQEGLVVENVIRSGYVFINFQC